MVDDLKMSNDFDEIVYVEGNIIIKATQYCCTYLMACGSEDYKNIATDIIHGDLVINDGFNKYSAFAYYIAQGDVISYTCCCPPWRESVLESFHIFEKGINDLKDLLHIQVKEDLAPMLCKCVWGYTFSLYESYIMNIFLTLFIFCPKDYSKYFEKYIKNNRDNWLKSHKLNELPKVVEEQMIRYVIRKKEWSNLEELTRAFGSLFGINIPSYEKIKDSYKIRNHVMHRNGEEDESGNKIIITSRDTEQAISSVYEFVSSLNTLIADFERKRLQYLASIG